MADRLAGSLAGKRDFHLNKRSMLKKNRTDPVIFAIYNRRKIVNDHRVCNIESGFSPGNKQLLDEVEQNMEISKWRAQSIIYK